MIVFPLLCLTTRGYQPLYIYIYHIPYIPFMISPDYYPINIPLYHHYTIVYHSIPLYHYIYIYIYTYHHKPDFPPNFPDISTPCRGHVASLGRCLQPGPRGERRAARLVPRARAAAGGLPPPFGAGAGRGHQGALLYLGGFHHQQQRGWLGPRAWDGMGTRKKLAGQVKNDEKWPIPRCFWRI